MKKVLLIAIVLLLVMALFVACNGNNNNPNGGGDTNGEDDNWQTIENEDENLVYTRLLRGIRDSLLDISKDRINNTYPLFSVDSKINLEINDLVLWLDIKINYNYQNPSELRIGVELLNEQEDSVVLGLYYYQEYIYIKLADGEAGEIKFPLESSLIQNIFPLELDEFEISDLATILNSVIRINGDITGRTRMYSHYAEYEYQFEINLANTLERIVTTLSPGGILQDFDSETLSLIIQRIMGVSFDDISTGNIPDSSIVVEFSTSNNKLTSFEMDLLVEQDGSQQNVLFGGDVISFTFDLQQLIINRGEAGTTDNFVSIPFFANNEHSSYPLYGNQSFGVQLNVTHKGEGDVEDVDYIVTGEVKLDLEEIINNEVLFEIKDLEDNKLWGAYIYRNMFYIYNSMDTDYQKVIEFPIDIMDIYDKVREFDSEDIDYESRDVLEYVAYFVGALRFHNEMLSYRIDSDFYNVLLPGFDQFFTLADEVLDDVDLINELEEADCDGVIDFLMANVFEIYIDLSEDAESFIYIVEGDIVFPEGVDGIVEEEEDEGEGEVD